MYAQEAQPSALQGYTIFVAEIASTFNEHMLLDYLMSSTTLNKEEKIMLLQKQIDEIFELFTNKQALIEKLAEMYAEPMETLMDDVNVDEGNAIAWDASF